MKTKIPLGIALFSILTAFYRAETPLLANAVAGKQNIKNESEETKVPSPALIPANFDPLSCDNPTAILPPTKINKGRGVSKYEFVLRNNTDADIEIATAVSSCGCFKIQKPDKIPPRGTAKLIAELEFTAKRFDYETYDIIVEAKDKTIPRLHLSITGRADFTTYLSTDEIAMGTCYIGKTRTSSIFVSSPSFNEKKNFVEHVRVDGGENDISIEIEDKISEYRKLSNGEPFFFNSSEIKLSIAPTSLRSDAQTAVLKIKTKDSKEFAIPISYRIGKVTPFDSPKYFISTAQAKTPQTLIVPYHIFGGGEIKTVKTNSAGLSVIETRKDGEIVFIKLQFVRKKRTFREGELLGKLLVENVNGQTHELQFFNSR